MTTPINEMASKMNKVLSMPAGSARAAELKKLREELPSDLRTSLDAHVEGLEELQKLADQLPHVDLDVNVLFGALGGRW